MPSNTSSSASRTIWFTASMFEPTLRCVSITPLGRPVEPEVKMTVNKSSSRIFVNPSQRSSQASGASQAAAAAHSLSAQVIWPKESSR